MGKFIEEFYYGNLDPQARSTKENKAVQKQMEVLMLNEDFLTENLSGESKKKFLEFSNAWSVVNGESDVEKFKQKLAEYEKITVRSKARELIRKLMKTPKFVFNKLFKGNGEDSKLEVVTSFLGLLELAKLKRISIQQKEQFGDIVVEKKDKE